MRFVYLIAALFLASLNLRPVITSVSPLLRTIQDSLGMSGAEASLLTSLPVLCMGFFAPAAVKLSNRLSLERTIAYCLLLIGLATAARYYAYSAWLMLLTAFLVGAGIAVIGPLLSGFIKKNFSNPSAIVGVYSMAMVVGAALGSGLSVSLQNALGHSWQASAASWSLLAVIALLLWWRPVKKTPARAEAAAVSSVPTNPVSGFKLPLKNKRAWLLTSFFGMMAFMFYSLTAWLPPIVQEQGYDKHTAKHDINVVYAYPNSGQLFAPHSRQPVSASRRMACRMRRDGACRAAAHPASRDALADVHLPGDRRRRIVPDGADAADR